MKLTDELKKLAKEGKDARAAKARDACKDAVEKIILEAKKGALLGEKGRLTFQLPSHYSYYSSGIGNVTFHIWSEEGYVFREQLCCLLEHELKRHGLSMEVGDSKYGLEVCVSWGE